MECAFHRDPRTRVHAPRDTTESNANVRKRSSYSHFQFFSQISDAGDPCAGYCLNGGTCTLIFSSTTPYCQCPFDYYGAKCQTTRSVQTTYVGCFDDSSASFTDYYVGSTAINTGTDCRDALIAYRKANPTSSYDFSSNPCTQFLNQQKFWSNEWHEGTVSVLHFEYAHICTIIRRT